MLIDCLLVLSGFVCGLVVAFFGTLVYVDREARRMAKQDYEKIAEIAHRIGERTRKWGAPDGENPLD